MRPSQAGSLRRRRRDATVCPRVGPAWPRRGGPAAHHAGLAPQRPTRRMRGDARLGRPARRPRRGRARPRPRRRARPGTPRRRPSPPTRCRPAGDRHSGRRVLGQLARVSPGALAASRSAASRGRRRRSAGGSAVEGGATRRVVVVGRSGRPGRWRRLGRRRRSGRGSAAGVGRRRRRSGPARRRRRARCRRSVPHACAGHRAAVRADHVDGLAVVEVALDVGRPGHEHVRHREQQVVRVGGAVVDELGGDSSSVAHIVSAEPLAGRCSPRRGSCTSAARRRRPRPTPRRPASPSAVSDDLAARVRPGTGIAVAGVGRGHRVAVARRRPAGPRSAGWPARRRSPADERERRSATDGAERARQRARTAGGASGKVVTSTSPPARPPAAADRCC